MVGRDFGAELFGTPESPTPTTETGRDFGAELFGAPPDVPDDLEAKLARAEARRAEFAPGQEFVRSVERAATADLPSLWEQAGVMKDVGAALTVGQRLDLFNKIDAGEITSPEQLRGLDMTTGQARMYLAAPPETRSKLRDRLTKELGSRKDLVSASLETLQKYQAERRRLGARVEKLTDIGNLTDFANWLASNVGAGAVNLIPIMLAAATTGGAGLLGVGTAMGTAESVGNRLQALQKELAETPEDQRANKVIQRLKETGSTDLTVGVISGALDLVLGPAASLVKQTAKSLAKQTRGEAAKAAIKETPRQMAEEFVTGGAQSLTQTAGKVATGEQEKFLTKETFIDALDDAAAEAAGAPAGTAFNAARAALVAGGSKEDAKAAADEATLLDRLAEGEDVAGPDELTGRTRVPVADELGRTEPTGGLDFFEPAGVVPAAEDAGGPPVRERAKPTPLTEDTVRQYNDLRQEAMELSSITRPTEADIRRLKMVQQDLVNLIDSVIPEAGNKDLRKQLKNPLFDGTQIMSALVEAPAGEARGMQGNLFGSFKGATRETQAALALAQRDPQAALEELEARRQRVADSQASGEYDANWGMRMAPTFGMSRAEGFNNPDRVAQLYVDKVNAEIDQATAIIQQSQQSRAMQGDLFAQQEAEAKQAREAEMQRLRDEQKAEREQKKAEEEFLGREADEAEMAEEMAPIEAELEATKEADEETKGEKAPPIDTEHVRQTTEGQAVLEFFDVVQPASTSKAEQQKRSYPQNTILEELLEYDITKPGQPTSAGAKTALNYLANRVGGMDAFRELVTALKGASPAQQARLLTRAGLPDLTSRRGMEQFSGQVQEYFKQLPAKGEGIQLPRKSMPSKVTGTPIPYKEEFTQGVTQTTTFEPLETGKPRRPHQGLKEKSYVLSDTKLRAAVRVLRDMADLGGKLSAPAKAALSYLRNRNRNSFNDALRDVAFDLAMYELDSKEYGANKLFYGEGGQYAQDFRAWIEQNLDQNTVDLLDELIADHKATAEANAKFAQALSEYHKKLDAFAESKRQKAEKSGAKLPKAPKKARDVIEETTAGEVEVTPEPTVPKKNLPRTQGLFEVHPAIRRALESGDTKKALELLSESKSNPYYALLAERLLEAGVTAKTVLIERDQMTPLHDTAEVRETADNFISGLRNLIATTVEQSRQKDMIALLESDKLGSLVEVLSALNTTPNMTAGQQQFVADARDFFNREYGWIGKYDPVSDSVFMRQGVGMTNHTFLHEVVHAAASGLIDRADTLQGVRRQGYDQLVELYNHTKGLLSQGGVDADYYGLQDIHEFLSEALTNPQFQAVLRGIRYKGSPFSLMNWFTTAIRKLFNIKEGRESNVLNEVIFAADALMLGGTAGKELITGVTQPRAMAKKAVKAPPVGRPNSKSAIKNLMTSRSWNEVKSNWPVFYSGLKASMRPVALGALTLRQIADLVNKRIPQLDNFIRVTEDFLARKNRILNESGEITKRWQRLQAINPDMSRAIGEVMHRATIQGIDPDKATAQQRNADPDLMRLWGSLNPAAKQIYRDTRDFYQRRYNEYKRTLRQRVIQMRQLGVSEATINEIRNEFEKGAVQGPYFPLMRFGRFWYQVGKGNDREYYMFESFGELQTHLRERLAQDPHLEDTLKQGDQYQKGMDLHARESAFLKAAFKAVDEAGTLDSQRLKDELYQSWLMNQPETSFRNRFVHRTNVEGFSQDALRSFASSAFHMAYQQARFEYSPDMFSQIAAARMQLKDRVDESNRADEEVMRENNELSDYVRELELRLNNIMNPEDTGVVVSTLSNIGFLWYLTSFASAATNVLGGMVIGLPTLVGQQVRLNPKMSYTTAALKSLDQMKTAAAQIMMTGFSLERGPRVRDNMVLFPSLSRATLSRRDQAAYDRFVADGLIDITAAYDQSGLAATPTESYDGIRHRAMTMLSALFHNAERFNREVVAMSAFRAGMEKRAGYKDQQKAFAESLAEAKDVTTRSMFDYSSTNKPRYMQSAPARVILQFKQFPQQMTFFLVRSLHQSLKGASPEVRREAIARFAGTMGMTAIFAGTTGLWGFSTVAAIVNAVMNGLRDEDEEEPFDFELEYMNAMVNTFGKNLGMFLTRGAGNAAGVDLHSRVSLDNMWFRDGRKNLDEEEAWRQFLVDLLGPTVGLTVSTARAVDLWNKGHADRALEAVAPGFIKQPLIAMRYADEGVTTMRGDKLVESITPFEVFIQSLGFRPADIAEIQYYNITKKAQEQEILKERQNLLNLYGLAFMSNDGEAFEKALEKIFKYNDKHPTTAIPMSSLNRSVRQRLEKSSQAEHGLIVDKRLQNLLDEEYIRKLRE